MPVGKALDWVPGVSKGGWWLSVDRASAPGHQPRLNSSTLMLEEPREAPGS